MRLTEYRTDDAGAAPVAASRVDTPRLSDGMLLDFAQRRPMLMPAPHAQWD